MCAILTFLVRVSFDLVWVSCDFVNLSLNSMIHGYEVQLSASLSLKLGFFELFLFYLITGVSEIGK